MGGWVGESVATISAVIVDFLTFRSFIYLFCFCLYLSLKVLVCVVSLLSLLLQQCYSIIIQPIFILYLIPSMTSSLREPFVILHPQVGNDKMNARARQEEEKWK